MLRDNKPIQIKYRGSILEIAQDGENAEVGVLVEGDVTFAFTITNNKQVSTIRKIDYSDKETIFILDNNGDGFADLKIILDNQNKSVVKKKIEFKVVE